MHTWSWHGYKYAHPNHFFLLTTHSQDGTMPSSASTTPRASRAHPAASRPLPPLPPPQHSVVTLPAAALLVGPDAQRWVDAGFFVRWEVLPGTPVVPMDPYCKFTPDIPKNL